MIIRRPKICFIDEILQDYGGTTHIPGTDDKDPQIAIIRIKFDRIFRMYSSVFQNVRAHISARVIK